MSVVVFHFQGLATKLGFNIPLYRAGETGVVLFFVLSGFLIARSVLSPAFSPRAYALNRAFRILPNYYFSILVVLFFVNGATIVTRDGLVRNIGSHLVLMHGLFRQYRTAINPVLWTLTIECIFYVFMLLVAPLLRHSRWRWWVPIGMILVGLVMRAAVWEKYQGHPIQLNFWCKQFPSTVDEFGCGVVVALLLQSDYARRLVARRYAKITGLFASVTLLVVAAITWDKYSPERTGLPFWHHRSLVIFWPLVFSAAAAGVVLFAQQFDQRFGRALGYTRLPYLGVISYSIYLFHTIVISTMTRTLGTTKSTLPAPLLAGIALAGILLVSAASYSLVERRFMDIRTRYTAT